MIGFLRVAAVSALFLLFGCGKSEAPKSADQLKAEKDAATQRTRENAVVGNELKVLDQAKAMQEQAAKQAEDTKKKIDEQAK